MVARLRVRLQRQIGSAFIEMIAYVDQRPGGDARVRVRAVLSAAAANLARRRAHCR